MIRLLFLLLPTFCWGLDSVTVGSKAFTEGFVLGELVAQKIESHGNINVVRRLGLGGTAILFKALQNNDIQLYVEYTGSIAAAILKKPELTQYSELQKALQPLNLVMGAPLGFNNSYALAVSQTFADLHHVECISDLKPILPDLRFGLSDEFVNRADGFAGLSSRYRWGVDARRIHSMEHSLSYEALSSGAVDVIDVYTTDAKIARFHLKVLQDDKHYFPPYQAVVLARADFVDAHPQIWSQIQELRGTLTAETMQHLNQGPDLNSMSFAATIADYLGRSPPASSQSDLFAKVWNRTKEHLLLVGVALFFSVLVGIPLGIVAVRNPFLGQAILILSGLLQTIPSLALLCFLVPLLGVGVRPALAALCLYGLLPVVLNTFVGLRSLDSDLIEVARALSLNARQRLWRIELPLAAPSILAGVKTSAIVGIGTATLAALIGAGGYGAPIVEGLAMNDNLTILMGAVPAAAMALCAHALFEWVGRLIIHRS
jgi:osmoprotectant transport system permease protein